jgi:tRNA threonylcarbamoyl adenosine modification protein YjeE
MQKNTLEYIISNEKEFDTINLDIIPGDRIFFIWDLGVGKSTFIRHLIRKHMDNTNLIVRSPTYTYYQQYDIIYHCDLYRLEDYSTWASIGWEEILQDMTNIVLIEWPQILSGKVQATKKVSMELMETGDRKITISTF